MIYYVVLVKSSKCCMAKNLYSRKCKMPHISTYEVYSFQHNTCVFPVTVTHTQYISYDLVTHLF